MSCPGSPPGVASFAGFGRAVADFAEAARRLFVHPDGNAIGFIATVSTAGRPHLCPVCPIFCGEHLYLSAGGHTPKVEDLRDNGEYVLHAFLGENDEEVQLAGRAREVLDHAERSAVHRAIPFAAFDRSDPVFRFDIERAFWVFWERVGQPDTRPIRKRWRED